MTALADAQGVVPRGFNGYDPAAFRRIRHRGNRRLIRRDGCAQPKIRQITLRNWRDLAVRKRKTEVDPQLTRPIAIAEKAGLAMPLTRKLVALIQDIEEGRRPLAIETLDALKAEYDKENGQ